MHFRFPIRDFRSGFAFSRFGAFAIILVLSISPCWAHDDAELGRHWFVPAYRIEMQSQILMMACIAAAVLGAMWIASFVRKRRRG